MLNTCLKLKIGLLPTINGTLKISTSLYHAPWLTGNREMLLKANHKTELKTLWAYEHEN